MDERAELPAFHKGFQLRLHRLEGRPPTRGAGKRRNRFWRPSDRIGLKRAGHVHEVEGVQNGRKCTIWSCRLLHPEHEVPECRWRSLGILHLESRLRGRGGGHAWGIGAHAAGALRESAAHRGGSRPDPKSFQGRGTGCRRSEASLTRADPSLPLQCAVAYEYGCQGSRDDDRVQA